MRLSTLLLLLATQIPVFAAPVRTITPKTPPNVAIPALKFALYLPARFANSSNRERSAGQGQFATVYEFQTASQPILYSLTVANHPRSEANIGAKTQLDLVEGRLLQGPRTKLEKNAPLRLNGFPGRDLRFRARGGAQLIRARLFTTPRRTYQLFARATPAQMQKMSAQVDKVLDSLRISG